MTIYEHVEPTPMLRAALKHCSVVHVVQRHLYSSQCIDTRNMTFVDSCDSTGSNNQFDEETAKACRDLNKPIYRVLTMNPSVVYKNIFCAICQVIFQSIKPHYESCKLKRNPSWIFLPHPDADSTPNKEKLPFSLLLNIGTYLLPSRTKGDGDTRVRNCSDTEWSSPAGDCIELRCTVGKLMDNRTCTAAFPFIRGLTYNFKLWLVADTDDNDEFFKLNDYFTLEQLLRSINKKMDSILVTSGVEYFANTALMKTSINLVENLYFTSTFIFSANYTLVGNFSLPRDSAEDQILETVLFSSVTVPIIDSISVKLRALSSLGGFVSCSRFATGGMVQCLAATRGNFSEKFYSGRAISLKNTLKCRFVSFNKSDYSVEMNDTEIPPSVRVLVRLKVVNLTFTESSELNSIELNQHGELNICYELLDKKLQECKRNKNLHHKGANLMRRAGYILTLTCASASMVCLLLTLMTYIRFPVLRNTAGKNTMFLCASLFLAQAMLLTSSHLSAPSIICTISGISTHFLWLWMLSWSFTCSYHMFQIFTSKAPKCARPRSAGPQIYKNIFRSLILPSIAVAGVIVFSSVYTSGLSYGYGNFACYIDAPMMNALTFVGPLTTITFSNIAFFLITVFKIQSIVKLQTTETFKKDDRHHVYVYIKLSLMTGGFWTLAILAEIVDNDVLRIVSILLNGLQGVVLFVSYSCNRRVYNMYISSRGDHSTSTTASVVARNVKLRLAYPE